MGFMQVTSYHDLVKFNECIYNQLGFYYPFQYLVNATVFGYKKGDYFVAGFILNDSMALMSNLRTLRQVPKVLPKWVHRLFFKHGNKCYEGTGAFIIDKSIGVYFTLRVGLWALSRGKYFFYCWDMKKPWLGRYYSKANPKILYEGLVHYRVGSEDTIHESWEVGYERVEMMTRCGIIRLFIYRTFKGLKRWILTRFFPI